MAASRAFRTTKISLSSLNLGDSEKAKLETAFTEFEVAKTVYVTEQRKALDQAARAEIAKQQAGLAQTSLLRLAADHDARIAAEPIWMIYKDQSGELIFEGITERLIRNNIRAQQEMLGKQLEGLEGTDNLFEEGDEQ